MGNREDHNHCTTKFIEIANELSEAGHDAKLISAALMSASGIYATYAAAGNEGALEASGVEKVVNLYRTNLEFIQERKKEEILKKMAAEKEQQSAEE